MVSPSPLQAKSPDTAWLNSYFQASLVAAKAYKIDAPSGVAIKLDQNESPWDWPPALKEKILQSLRAKEWNRYPESMAHSLTQVLAEYVGVRPECLLTSPGSNHLIALILDALGRCLPGKVVIARPSFALFESHCQYAGIPYETWDLDEQFHYRVERLPALTDGSLVVFASPNNPTGGSLPKSEFRNLLAAYPKVLFLADEAYYEFDDDPYTDLLSEFSNLLILRTLSKTMGAAGVRLGYAIGSVELIALLTKLRLPYLLNHFTMAAAAFMLKDPEMQDFVERNIENARSERDRVFTALTTMPSKNHPQVFNSKANFLLLRWPEQADADLVYRGLLARGILLRNVSAGPGLRGCLRVSIGLAAENDQFLKAMAEICC